MFSSCILLLSYWRAGTSSPDLHQFCVAQLGCKLQAQSACLRWHRIVDEFDEGLLEDWNHIASPSFHVLTMVCEDLSGFMCWLLDIALCCSSFDATRLQSAAGNAALDPDSMIEDLGWMHSKRGAMGEHSTKRFACHILDQIWFETTHQEDGWQGRWLCLLPIVVGVYEILKAPDL